MEATINGARIHYERAGAGMPVVFLHAGVADHRMWEPQVRAFAGDYDVIAPDMRGFGQSELPPRPWSPVGDVLGLIDELGLKPAHLIGCSIGGGVAIDFALEHGERISKLVLVGPGVGGIAFGEKYPELFADADAAEKSGDHRAIQEADARLWLDGPKRRPGYVKNPIRELFFEMNSNFDTDWASAPIEKIEPAAAERLHEITAPTLVVVGDNDAPPVFDAVELLMEKVPHARKAVIHDAAHLPNLEHPQEFNRVVLEFLAG
ncbi:MAG TPA: alpha/beta hydrolase [Candidatus Dormibacteraeota bacterium]|nr:alpha/beta hydrolase [Candidatus Dormibacteraeota bacterium]